MRYILVIFKIVIIYILVTFIFSIIKTPDQYGYYHQERLVVESPDKKYRLHFIDKKNTFSSNIETKIYLENIEEEKIINYMTIYNANEVRTINNNSQYYNNIHVNWVNSYILVNVEVLEPEYVYSYHFEPLNEQFTISNYIQYIINVDEAFDDREIDDTKEYYSKNISKRYTYE